MLFRIVFLVLFFFQSSIEIVLNIWFSFYLISPLLQKKFETFINQKAVLHGIVPRGSTAVKSFYQSIVLDDHFDVEVMLVNFLFLFGLAKSTNVRRALIFYVPHPNTTRHVVHS